MANKPLKAYRVKVSIKDGKLLHFSVMWAKDLTELDSLIWRVLKFDNPFLIKDDYEIQIVEVNGGKPMYLNESVGR